MLSAAAWAAFASSRAPASRSRSSLISSLALTRKRSVAARACSICSRIASEPSVGVLALRELTLQDLTRRVTRKFVEKDNLARNLVFREVLLDVALQVVLADFLAVLRYHEDHQALTEILVVDADRRRLLHRLVVGKQVLDLAREDVLTTGDDHLIVSSVDEEAPVLVEVANIAGGEQLAELLLVPAARVALERQLIADEDPAGVARLDVVFVIVDDPDHRSTRRSAGRAGGGPH